VTTNLVLKGVKPRCGGNVGPNVAGDVLANCEYDEW
jgi:hypothetical protein